VEKEIVSHNIGKEVEATIDKDNILKAIHKAFHIAFIQREAVNISITEAFQIISQVLPR
jgi:hypothetical protein